MSIIINNFEKLLRIKYNAPEPARLPEQTVIANDIGISQPTVSLWLSGEVRQFHLETVLKICKFLKCNMADLFEIVENEGQTVA